MKIAIISHKTSNLLSARGDLIKKIIENGHEVIAICNENKNKKDFEKLGAKCYYTPFSRNSISIINNLKYLKQLKKVLKKENVDIVLSYTIKPIIFGSIAAKQSKVPKIYSLITGMGYIYSKQNLKTKIIRVFCNIGYKIAMKYNTKVIFQNQEDKEEFIKRKWIRPNKGEIVEGSGVDMNVFKKSNVTTEPFTFLMISRILDVKGVYEYCKAAEKVAKLYPTTKFIHIGEDDRTNRGLKKKQKSDIEKTGIVKFMRKKEKYRRMDKNKYSKCFTIIFKRGSS